MTETATMWIKTAWIVQGNETPWMLSSYDERTFEAWGEEPDWYCDALRTHADDEIREVYVNVPIDRIDRLFEPTTLDGEVVPDSGRSTDV